MEKARSRKALAAALLAGCGVIISPFGAEAFDFYPTPIGLNKTKSNPYHFVGNLTYLRGGTNYHGSATLIRQRGIITCAHTLYNSSTGWSTRVKFHRARYYSYIASKAVGNRLFILGGYAGLDSGTGSNTGEAFARDLGGVNVSTYPASGGHAGWWANPSLLTGTAFNMSLGYGGENHSGEEILRSSASKAFSPSYGAYYTNTSYRVEAGMSGGPIFAFSDGIYYVAAVNVSGNSRKAGVRILDNEAYTFINRNLSD